jgi:hypothetical protein
MASGSIRIFTKEEEENKLVARYKQLLGVEKDSTGGEPAFDVVYPW